ncbi:MAG: Bax inhibitor-1/YccA family protein [Candidatus Nanopelagicales bacterium]
MASRNPIIRRAEEQYAQDYSGPGFASINNQPGQPQQAGQPQQPAAQQPQVQQVAPQTAAGAVPPPPGSTADLNNMYAAPARAGFSGPAMTIHDVIMKTTLNFGILFVGAVFGWVTAQSMPYVWIVAALVGMGLAFANIFKKQISPVLVMAYALVEGVFLGGISNFYQAYGEANGYGNLVLTAVVATFTVFAVMLALYTTRIIKVNGRFKKIMLVALISYAVFALASFVAAMFGVGDGFGFFGVGIIGIAFSVFAVCLAAFCLMLDFDAIEEGMKYGVPERESWRMAFGLMVTLIWLYLEILRLLAILSGRD